VRDAPRARWHAVRARAGRERRHRLGIGLGQDGLGCVQGRWHAGDPLEAGLGQLGQIRGARASPVGHERGGGGRGVELRHGVTDDLAERFAIMTMATQGLHQHRETGLGLHPSFHHHLVEVRAMLSTRARGDVDDLGVRRRRAVLPALDRKTRCIAMAERARQP
jgi:hypothetical protein